MWDVVLDTLLDTVRLLPFLFIAYLLMEFIEHKAGEKTEKFLRSSGKAGPVYGGLLGVIPQCGFSAAASGLFSGRVITLGTLIAVYLSTSDEMIPVMISEQIDAWTIVKILLIKVVYGILIGFIIDLVYRKKDDRKIGEICEHEHCHCEKGIFVSSLIHMTEVAVYIFLFSFILNTLIFFIGEDNIKSVVLDTPVIGNFISGLVGLIPNCASSVIITELYIADVISFGELMSGLFVGAGIGLVVLFRANKNIRQNLAIVCILYASGVVGGLLTDLVGAIIGG